MTDLEYLLCLMIMFCIACVVWPDVGQAASFTVDMIPSHQCITDSECEAICLTIADCDVLNQRFFMNQEK